MRILKTTKLMFITYALLILSSSLLAQTKFEKESRLNVKEVPTSAKQFISILAPQARVKWFKEISLTQTSLEAKLKIEKAKYSVEFDTSGNLEDVEIEIDLNSLKPYIKNNITKALEAVCQKYKVKKTQIQYSGNQKIVLSFLKDPHSSNGVQTRYELIVKCCNRHDVNLYEFLFDTRGHLINKSKIVFKPSSNLEY